LRDVTSVDNASPTAASASSCFLSSACLAVAALTWASFWTLTTRSSCMRAHTASSGRYPSGQSRSIDSACTRGAAAAAAWRFLVSSISLNGSWSLCSASRTLAMARAMADFIDPLSGLSPADVMRLPELPRKLDPRRAFPIAPATSSMVPPPNRDARRMFDPGESASAPPMLVPMARDRFMVPDPRKLPVPPALALATTRMRYSDSSARMPSWSMVAVDTPCISFLKSFSSCLSSSERAAIASRAVSTDFANAATLTRSACFSVSSFPICASRAPLWTWWSSRTITCSASRDE